MPEIGKDELSHMEGNRTMDFAERRKNYALAKDDSIDELMKKVYAPRKRVEIEVPKGSDGEDSGRSTPEHLKKYGGSADVGETAEDEKAEGGGGESARRTRTFSDTLKMLDDDILAELNINK